LGTSPLAHPNTSFAQTKLMLNLAPPVASRTNRLELIISTTELFENSAAATLWGYIEIS